MFLRPTCLISDMTQVFQIQFHSRKNLVKTYLWFILSRYTSLRKIFLTREARRFFRVRFSPPPPLASAGLSRANLARISSGNLISVGSDNRLIASCLKLLFIRMSKFSGNKNMSSSRNFRRIEWGSFPPDRCL